MAQTSPPPAAILSLIVEAGNGLLQTKYAYLAAYAVAVYDHFLTMDIEIEHVWKRKFTAVTGLYILTRYYFIVAMTLVLFVFVIPLVSTTILIYFRATLNEDPRCDKLLLFVPVGAGTPFTTLPNILVALRVYALYERNSKLALALFFFVAAETGVSLWLDLTPTVSRIDVFAILGFPQISDAPAMHFCVPQLSASLTGLKSTSAQIMQTVFDTTVLALVLYKARRGGSGIVALMARQGIAYYLLNLAVYLAWTLMLVIAPPESKYVMGGPALGLVCVSTNRLTLHLRNYNSDFDSQKTMAPFEAARVKRRGSWVGVSTLDVREVHSDGGLSTLELDDFCANGVCDANGSERNLKFDTLSDDPFVYRLPK